MEPESFLVLYFFSLVNDSAWGLGWGNGLWREPFFYRGKASRHASRLWSTSAARGAGATWGERRVLASGPAFKLQVVQCLGRKGRRPLLFRGGIMGSARCRLLRLALVVILSEFLTHSIRCGALGFRIRVASDGVRAQARRGVPGLRRGYFMAVDTVLKATGQPLR